jgi:sulfite reductase (NADPH) flavoprotein alpha-component
MRRLHSIAGLFGAVIVTFMAVTGLILSLQPAFETMAARAWTGAANAGELAAAAASELPGLERITQSASGTVVAYYVQDGVHQAVQIDPSSGAVIGPYQPSSFFAFVTELHRSIFLGDMGHAVAGIASLFIALLAASGVVLLVHRMGGWRLLFARLKGTGMQRVHARLARLALVALALTSFTGVFMSAVNFGFVPDGSGFDFAALPQSSGAAAAPIDQLTALTATPLRSLRELVFPAVGDLNDVFTLTTASGVSYIDQASGTILQFTPNNFWQQIYQTIYLLHTGDGVWWLALILGAAAAAVPAMVATGVAIWWQRRGNTVQLRDNASWRSADTVILFGSENNSTEGFAASLHATLVGQGHRVHTAAMNTVRRYPKAQRLLVLTATYGDGGAPQSAHRFLSRLQALKSAPAPEFAVLGFGDRSFSQYCAFAEACGAALTRAGSWPLLGFDTVDRQSGQDFARWGTRLGAALGMPLALSHAPLHPALHGLRLVEREDYGLEVQAPTTILRFAATETRTWFGRRARLPRFAAGDLVGITPPGSTVPRYYSIASSSRDGVLEICVRKQAGGQASEFLHGLTPGDKVGAFIRRNPDFRPLPGRKPIILIGAGAGVAPLVGFVRANRPGRRAYLFFGARDPASDFLYKGALGTALTERRLTGLETAFSRVVGGEYVQHRLASQADLLCRLVEDGAQVLVCGGLEMAREVRATLDTVLAPLALTTAELKAQGRYLEDAY